MCAITTVLGLLSGSVLNRLGDVRGLNGLDSGEVGDGAGQFEDAVKGAGRKLELYLYCPRYSNYLTPDRDRGFMMRPNGSFGRRHS